MNSKQANRWIEEITFWANGGELWFLGAGGTWRQRTSDFSFCYTIASSYVIKDKHFEARKADALGEAVEYMSAEHIWEKATNPSWSDNLDYRAKPKAWYDSIPDGGILCWVWDGPSDKGQYCTIITEYTEGAKWRFIDARGDVWVYATPVKPEECYQEESIRGV